MPFPQAPAGARRILGRWRRSGWLWYCGKSCWGCSRLMTKRSSPAGSGWGRRMASERKVQSRSTPSETKPGSLWTCESAPSPTATPRVCYRPPVYTRVMWALLETTPKTITVAGNFVFITLGMTLLFVAIKIFILGRLAMVLLS